MLYSFAKNILKKIAPQKFIFEHEEWFRKFLIPIYKGKNHQCQICETNLKNFQILENGNLLCPICGSLPRTRRLWKILEENYLLTNSLILDFSPSRAIFRKLKENKNLHYFSTDFEDEFLADYHYDITQIACKNDFFDLIISYHILEHITEDDKAISELFRVLKKGGTCLIQTPFQENLYEDYSIITKEERFTHFGQDDHVRIYSVAVLKQRLENAGFSVDVKSFKKNQFLGLSENEIILVCKK